MAGKRIPVLAILAALALAGCTAVTEERPAPATSGAAAQTQPSSPFRLVASGCTELGGHSLHPDFGDYLPPPWEPADVLDDVGEQPVTTEWYFHPLQTFPEKGETMGNWHVTMVCDSWNLGGEDREMVFGYVAMRVEPPPFDDAANPAARHYLVTVLGTDDHEFHELLHAAGFHASMSKGSVRYEAPGIVRSILDTEDHGIYDSIFRPKEVGAMTDALTRLWFQMENDDGTFSPIALDFENVRLGTHLQADGSGYFSHFRTEDHAPLPGAAGDTPALGWGDFDRVITLGPRPDVRLKEAYVHV